MDFKEVISDCGLKRYSEYQYVYKISYGGWGQEGKEEKEVASAN